MDHLTPCWNTFVVLLLLLTTAVDKIAVTGTVIFPDPETCTVETGEQGICLPLLDCPPVRQTFKEHPPVTCGFEGFTQIVCCPKDTTTKDKLVDISPPSGYDNLDCGKSAIKRFGPIFGLSASSVSLSGANIPSDTNAKLLPPERFSVEIAVTNGEISQRNSWPWMALIGEKDAVGTNWFCGGALINEYWVLTAFHCFQDNKADVVRLGEHNYNDNNDGADHEDINVVELVLYPDYKHPEAYHDLALLRLERKVTLQKFILPVCLPWGDKSKENIVNITTTIVGWGNTLYGGSPSPVLMEADVRVFPSSRCDNSYSSLPHYSRTWPQGIGEETLCAGDPEGGKDSCQGDSGGPLVTRDGRGRYVAGGVVSRGYGCGHKDYPGLYANLRYPAYLAWIKKVAFGSQ